MCCEGVQLTADAREVSPGRDASAMQASARQVPGLEVHDHTLELRFGNKTTRPRLFAEFTCVHVVHTLLACPRRPGSPAAPQPPLSPELLMSISIRRCAVRLAKTGEISRARPSQSQSHAPDLDVDSFRLPSTFPRKKCSAMCVCVCVCF